jgi:hypothetical protein
MPAEDTLLDGPVTPAPVFAYRAVRGLFFASPESPEHAHHDKENIPFVRGSSPSKSQTAAMVVSVAAPLTPSKRKRDGGGGPQTILSPTKGILRTPGLATPRAKQLKDLNVKFKGVSPEIQLEPARNKSEHGSSSAAAAAVATSLSPAKNHGPRQNNPKSSAGHGLSASAASTTSTRPERPNSTMRTSSVEAYMRQTEHEMKKVVGYGQKMREYARRKDAENAELRAMVDRLKRENERLRQKMAGSHSSELKSVEIRTVSSSLPGQPRGQVRDEVDRVESALAGQQQPKRPAEPKMESTAPARPPPIDNGHAEGPHTKRNPPAASTDHNTTTSPTVRRKASTATTDPTESSVSPPDHSRRFQSLPIHSSMATRHAAGHTAGSVRLPPDRLAAARARLRRRAEARKASVETDETDHRNDDLLQGFDDDDKKQNQPVQSQGHRNSGARTREKPPMAKTVDPNIFDIREQSLVDWANL